nr:MAG TPA: hypothetical protein [Caudoviricetes sp.]
MVPSLWRPLLLPRPFPRRLLLSLSSNFNSFIWIPVA